MATVKQVVGARTALNVTGLATLGNGAYAVSDVVNNTTNQPLDLLVELVAIPGTVSAGTQAVLFAQASLNNASFQTGNNSVDEMDMTLIGVLPLKTNSTGQIKIFPVASAFGGSLPPFLKFVVKNDSGSSFSNAAVYFAEVSATVT